MNGTSLTPEQNAFQLVANLRDAAVARGEADVQLLQTHISWLLLAGAHAYKFKKPLKLDFLDFSTLQQRHAACLEELRINRRTAPDLYLSVQPVTGTLQAPRIGGAGEPLDWVVCMRRFPAHALMAEMAARGELAASHMDALARAIAAFHGKSVTAYNIDAAALERARDALTRLAQTYAADLPGTTPEATTRVAAAIALSSDLAQAVRDADLVIEAVPEKLELKRSVYAELARLAREGTIFATNSSTLLPSALADATGRPEKFLALHFANHIWRQNTAEVMGTPQTDPEVFEQVARFAAEIGMEPIRLHKEQPGYVLNSLLVPLLNAAAALLLKGVASPEDIDKTWRIGTGAKLGPFQIYDIVGLRTAYNIASANPATQGWAEYLKVNYIDKGRLGAGAGGGFYDD